MQMSPKTHQTYGGERNKYFMCIKTNLREVQLLLKTLLITDLIQRGIHIIIDD